MRHNLPDAATSDPLTRTESTPQIHRAESVLYDVNHEKQFKNEEKLASMTILVVTLRTQARQLCRYRPCSQLITEDAGSPSTTAPG